MIHVRMLPAAWLVLAACGSTTPTPNPEPQGEVGPASAKTSPPASASAEAPPEDVASFAAAPEAVPYGSELRFTYEGATVKLTESALVPVGKGYSLRYKQPAGEGAHVVTLTTGDLEPGKPAAIEGDAALFLQLSDGKKADGSFKLLDVTSSCRASGTLTLPEAPKPAGKAKGSVEVTVTCKGVSALKSPFSIKGEFSEVPLRAK
jgi:hypothetical protein